MTNTTDNPTAAAPPPTFEECEVAYFAYSVAMTTYQARIGRWQGAL